MAVAQFFRRWIKPKSSIDLILLTLFAAMLPFLFLGDFGGSESRLPRMISNLGHYVLFGTFTLLVLARIDVTTVKQFAWIVAVVLVLGLAVEGLQYFTPRDADMRDVLSNVVGSLVVLFWYWKPSRWIWTGRVLTTALLLQPVAAIAYVGYWEYRISAEIPLLSTFEYNYDVSRWQCDCELSMAFVSQGDRSLKVRLTTDQYSGASFDEPTGNWSQYASLKFDLYNPADDNLSLTLRIHDRLHRHHHYRYSDRFNRRFDIAPGWNRFTVSLPEVRFAPATREMDMENIADIALFATNLPRPRIIYTDNWRLE